MLLLSKYAEITAAQMLGRPQAEVSLEKRSKDRRFIQSHS